MKKIYAFIWLIFVAACGVSELSKEVWIDNAQGEKIYIKIDGLDNVGYHKLAVLQHGLASDMNHATVQTAKKAFLDNHYVVVTFDSRYSLGQGDNDVEKVRLKTFYEDLQTVTDWAKTQDFYQEPFAVVGHSLGGASALLFGAEYPEKIDVLMPIAPVISGDLWEKSCMNNMADFCRKWKQKGVYEYTDPNNHKTAFIPYAVIDDSKDYNAEKIADKIKAKTLLIGAQNDIITDENDLQKLSSLIVNGQAVVVESSGHNFEDKQNQEDLYQEIIKFLK